MDQTIPSRKLKDTPEKLSDPATTTDNLLSLLWFLTVSEALLQSFVAAMAPSLAPISFGEVIAKLEPAFGEGFLWVRTLRSVSARSGRGSGGARMAGRLGLGSGPVATRRTMSGRWRCTPGHRTSCMPAPTLACIGVRTAGRTGHAWIHQ